MGDLTHCPFRLFIYAITRQAARRLCKFNFVEHSLCMAITLEA